VLHLTQVSSCVWLTFFLADPVSEISIGESAMRTLFSTLPWVEAAVALLPQAIPTYAPLRELFQACDKQHDDGVSGTQVLHGCPRSTFVPDLIVRPARVEDHDDLVPVFNKQSTALTAIYGEFFLAELIQSQNEANKAIVGEVRISVCAMHAPASLFSVDQKSATARCSTHNVAHCSPPFMRSVFFFFGLYCDCVFQSDHQSVGLMALTTELDVRILQKCFELGPYDNLLRVTDEASAERAQAVEDAATGTHTPH
jgi:hypothetical protein